MPGPGPRLFLRSAGPVPEPARSHRMLCDSVLEARRHQSQRGTRTRVEDLRVEDNGRGFRRRRHQILVRAGRKRDRLQLAVEYFQHFGVGAEESDGESFTRTVAHRHLRMIGIGSDISLWMRNQVDPLNR